MVPATYLFNNDHEQTLFVSEHLNVIQSWYPLPGGYTMYEGKVKVKFVYKPVADQASA